MPGGGGNDECGLGKRMTNRGRGVVDRYGWESEQRMRVGGVNDECGLEERMTNFGESGRIGVGE
eukprot:1161490-Pelagomonas_calceolata.AAC.3